MPSVYALIAQSGALSRPASWSTVTLSMELVRTHNLPAMFQRMEPNSSSGDTTVGKPMRQTSRRPPCCTESRHCGWWDCRAFDCGGSRRCKVMHGAPVLVGRLVSYHFRGNYVLLHSMVWVLPGTELTGGIQILTIAIVVFSSLCMFVTPLDG